MLAFPDPAMLEQAIAWHLRLKDADEDTWVEFAEWLNADPAHNDAYEAVANRDAYLSSALEKATFPSSDQHEPAPDEDAHAHEPGDGIARRSHWRWGAIAASMAVAGVFAVQMLSNRDTSYAIATAVGETRTVSLADGSEILLNGNTEVILDRNDARLVEIARGEARFAVKHDETDPFTVVAGDQRLVDIGTVFNVVRTDRHLRVGVAEGAVRYQGTARTVELRAGDNLAADGRGKIEISQSPVASIGSWADGELVYDQTPLAQVTDDLYRSTGISLKLPPGMDSRRFSGVIQTNGDRDAVRARLEVLIDAKIVADGARWSVEAR
ncbi:FecR domain-containing protein [Novosphingobium sp. KN65.2]|uniref:FecR family protein n=1 Tax=Novosphingobium sp. KN65.2 TaxID=1478134 RepID=UPI0005DF14D9|nr:FecR domain-containing protein [Novosphingobium sp. KN65.2]CDO33968.1 putative Anti-FecI sigma factor, FecR [Novosphingobium sp. KN65.2]